MASDGGQLLALVTVGVLVAGLSGSSCIIPDHGIVGSESCGARWCATAEYAQALGESNNIVQVQQTQPDGTTGWVTACICMTPSDDLVLRSGMPQIQYELLRTQVIDAARQACLDAAIANNLEPDPPYPLDEELEPSCYEAVTEIFHDGCCSLLSTQCEGFSTCLGDPATGGHETEGPATDGDATTSDPSDVDSADTTAGLDGASSGSMMSLEPYYDEVSCLGSTCHIGQPLIDAMLSSPRAVLAERTTLSFAAEDGSIVGLQLHGVGANGLARRLGLREGDVILRVAHLPLTREAELVEALALAQEAEELTVLVRRDGSTHERRFVRWR